MEDFHCDIFLDTNFLTDPKVRKTKMQPGIILNQKKKLQILKTILLFGKESKLGNL